MYDFNESASNDTRDFFGYNKGLPMMDPESDGMLVGGENLL